MLASGLLPVALPACLTILVLMSVWRQRKLEGKLPPGPTPLPFVGNYLQLNTKQMYNSFMKRGIEERIQGEADFLIEVCRGTRDWHQTAKLTLPQIPVFNDLILCEMFYSVTKHLPGPQQQAFKELQGLEDFIAEKVEQSRCALDPNSPWNLIDSFFIRMQEEKKNPNTEFYLKNLVLTTLNLFFAGTETVSTTLLLMKHPDVEARSHEEIDHVIGKNHQPKFKDGAKMPYTEAVLSAHPSPTPPYQSPLPPPNQGAEVFPMLGSVLRDPKFFSNRRDFNPQHFLDEKGQFKKSDAFVPFSIGKRYCFGEGLARMELFLFLTTIMQNFRFKSPQSPLDIDVSPKHVGFVTIPRNYTMSFLP
ncbi:hypothetical protein E2I00_012074, partial [Balaenoptera physalus]